LLLLGDVWEEWDSCQRYWQSVCDGQDRRRPDDVTDCNRCGRVFRWKDARVSVTRDAKGVDFEIGCPGCDQWWLSAGFDPAWEVAAGRVSHT
jgi:hypothetical protein